jgi:hypothetical protein
MVSVHGFVEAAQHAVATYRTYVNERKWSVDKFSEA